MDKGLARQSISVLRGVLALIGGLVVAVIALFGLLMTMMSYDAERPVKWPKPDRECLADGAKSLTDAQLIAAAVAAWNREGEQYTDEFREERMGGTLISDGSLVQWGKTDPGVTVHVYDIEDGGEYEQSYKYARMGLSRYAIVSLQLSGYKSAEMPAGNPTRRQYQYDACGQEL